MINLAGFSCKGFGSSSPKHYAPTSLPEGAQSPLYVARRRRHKVLVCND